MSWHILIRTAFLLLDREGKAVLVWDRESVPDMTPGKYSYVRSHEQLF